MWQTNYASAVPKILGVGVDFRPCSEGNFLTGRLYSMEKFIHEAVYNLQCHKNKGCSFTVSPHWRLPSVLSFDINRGVDYHHLDMCRRMKWSPIIMYSLQAATFTYPYRHFK